jgi:hypothetical protein
MMVSKIPYPEIEYQDQGILAFLIFIISLIGLTYLLGEKVGFWVTAVGIIIFFAIKFVPWIEENWSDILPPITFRY